VPAVSRHHPRHQRRQVDLDDAALGIRIQQPSGELARRQRLDGGNRPAHGALGLATALGVDNDGNNERGDQPQHECRCQPLSHAIQYRAPSMKES
jgi:hypothetical protein